MYEVFLYTTLDKNVLKDILVGMEYLNNGDRIVDLDLFSNKKKVRWSILKTEEIYKKIEVGVASRNRLLNKLNNNQIEILKTVEAEIKNRDKN